MIVHLEVTMTGKHWSTECAPGERYTARAHSISEQASGETQLKALGALLKKLAPELTYARTIEFHVVGP